MIVGLGNFNISQDQSTNSSTQQSIRRTTYQKISFTFSGIIFLSWLFAIGSTSQRKLETSAIKMNPGINYSLLMSLLLFSGILYNFFTVISALKLERGGYIHYSKPILISILFLISYIITIASTARLLVSAERSKVANFNEYFCTMLLLVIPLIGLWFIQPRAYKIKASLS